MSDFSDDGWGSPEPVRKTPQPISVPDDSNRRSSFISLQMDRTLPVVESPGITPSPTRDDEKSFDLSFTSETTVVSKPPPPSVFGKQIPTNVQAFGSNPVPPAQKSSAFGSESHDSVDFGVQRQNATEVERKFERPPFGAPPTKTTVFGVQSTVKPSFLASQTSKVEQETKPSGFGATPVQVPKLQPTESKPSGFGGEKTKPSGFGEKTSVFGTQQQTKPSGFGDDKSNVFGIQQPTKPSGFGLNDRNTATGGLGSMKPSQLFSKVPSIGENEFRQGSQFGADYTRPNVDANQTDSFMEEVCTDDETKSILNQSVKQHQPGDSRLGSDFQPPSSSAFARETKSTFASTFNSNPPEKRPFQGSQFGADFEAPGVVENTKAPVHAPAVAPFQNRPKQRQQDLDALSDDGWGEENIVAPREDSVQTIQAETSSMANQSQTVIGSQSGGFGQSAFGSSNEAARNQGFGQSSSGGFGSSSRVQAQPVSSSGGFGAQPRSDFGSKQSSGGFGAGAQSGFATKSSSGGFGAGGQDSGFGSKPPSGGFGAQAQSGFGGKSSSGGFGSHSSNGELGSQSQPGFGTSSQSGSKPSFGGLGSQTQSGFGSKAAGEGLGTQSQPGFGTSSQSGSKPSFGGLGSQTQSGFGSKAAGGGLGTQTQSGFGAPSQSSSGGLGAQVQSGFGSRNQDSGFGSKSASGGFGVASQDAGFGSQQKSGGFGSSAAANSGQTSGGFGSNDQGFGRYASTNQGEDRPFASNGTEQERKCYNCRGGGHRANDCPEPPRPKTCSNCGAEGHFSRDCDQPRKPRPCFNCRQEGHNAAECQNERVEMAPPGACNRCKEEGHWSKDCPSRPRDLDGNVLEPHEFVPRVEDELFETIKPKAQWWDDEEQDIVISMADSNIPDIKSFEQFPQMDAQVLANLKRMKLEIPMPIQRAAYRQIYSGTDVVACAHTGSGKTLAFLLPLVTRLLQSSWNSDQEDDVPSPRLVIVAPTRELALQTFEVVRMVTYKTTLTKDIVYGGTSRSGNLQQLTRHRKLAILIGTIGRLKDFVASGELSLSKVQHIVLDEADRMVDAQDFGQEVVELFKSPDDRTAQMTLFSASFKDEIQKQDLLNVVKSNFAMITVNEFGTANRNIKQDIICVDRSEKLPKLLEILGIDDNYEMIEGNRAQNEKTLIFVNSVKFASTLAARFSACGLSVMPMHSYMNQQQREQVLKEFESGKYHILVASNVCARGLDISGLNHVINYDMPDGNGFDEYVNRIGRTGRAGFHGDSTAFFDQSADIEIAEPLIHVLEKAGKPVPEWLKNLSQTSSAHKNAGEAEEEW